MSDQELIEKLRLGALPKEAQEQTLAAVNNEIEMRLAGVIDDILTDEQRAEFEKLANQTPEKVFEWLSQEITDLSKLYKDVLEDYIEEMNAKVDEITK